MKRATSTFLSVLALTSLGCLNAWGGQFRRVTYYGDGYRQQPYHVVASHLTSSGNVDLAVGDYLSDRVSILLGNGDGTLQKALTFPVPAPIDIAVGDFNEDGIQDLAVVETGGTADGALAIFLGDGQGHFKLSASYALGVGSDQVAVADLNGDRHLDVAVTNFGFSGAQGSVMTFFGDGHGKMKDRKTYTLEGEPAGIAAGGLNGDHYPDLAVTQFSMGSVAIFLNDGTGRFKKPVSYSWNGSPVDVKIADLRNNGKQDLVIADDAQGMVVLLNKGDGTFGKATIYQPTFFNWQPPEACTVADFNLDGKLDVACATSVNDGYYFYGKGDGTFKPGIEIKEAIHSNGGFSIASGDFNHDGAPDLAFPIEENDKVAIVVDTANNTFDDVYIQGGASSPMQDGISIGVNPGGLSGVAAQGNILSNIQGVNLINVVHIGGGSQAPSGSSNCPNSSTYACDVNVFAVSGSGVTRTIEDDLYAPGGSNTYITDANVGMYVLGELVAGGAGNGTASIGYSRVTTSPSVPTWFVGPSSPLQGHSCTIGDLFSTTSTITNFSLWECVGTSGTPWLGVK